MYLLYISTIDGENLKLTQLTKNKDITLELG